MFKSSSRRDRSFRPSVMGLDIRVIPVVALPPGGCVPMVPLIEMVDLSPPPMPTSNVDADLVTMISLTDGL